jgi:predicted nucleotide-binding protein
MEPIDRFLAGPASPTLLDALRDQFVVHGDGSLASELAKVVKLAQHLSGTTLIQQDHADNTIFLILLGEVSIVINGQEIARRHANQHVGEMALLDPSARRSASVIARGIVVTAQVTERDFTALASKYPLLWRRIAAELGNRLRQRSGFIREKNETPILFFGSSSESLPIVNALVDGLHSAPFITRPWHRGIFVASQFPIDDLAKQVTQADFAALVLSPDDEVISRSIMSDAPRDNVLLELGLFIGSLGRSRTFLIVPRDVNIKIPTDIFGLTPIRFSLKGGSLTDNLAPVCRELVELVARQGSR